LIGQNTPHERVVLENAGNQRNGIVVVPPGRNQCLSCHVSVAPPFELHPHVELGTDPEPDLHDVEIRGITIRNFVNNGLFTERVDGFRIIDVESAGNENYGIFPTLSRNGIIAQSRVTGADDSGIWVETSENVLVTHNLVEGNTNGIEVSNSDDVELSWNTARHNTAGFAIFLLPDIFEERPGSRRLTVRNNLLDDNNKPNAARAGSILAVVPRGSASSTSAWTIP
jgi:parallel beta-helix repeat protein